LGLKGRCILNCSCGNKDVVKLHLKQATHIVRVSTQEHRDFIVAYFLTENRAALFSMQCQQLTVTGPVPRDFRVIKRQNKVEIQIRLGLFVALLEGIVLLILNH
jgi:hypothetical protein